MAVDLAGVVLMHLGKLHPYEHALVLLLAFGPFVALAIVITVMRRREARESGETSVREPEGSPPTR